MATTFRVFVVIEAPFQAPHEFAYGPATSDKFKAAQQVMAALDLHTGADDAPTFTTSIRIDVEHKHEHHVDAYGDPVPVESFVVECDGGEDCPDNAQEG